MKYKLTDGEKDYIHHIEKQTLSKYKIDKQDYIEIETFFTIMEDLMGEIGYLEDKVNELEHNEDGSVKFY